MASTVSKNEKSTSAIHNERAQKISVRQRSKFVSDILGGLLRYAGAVKIDDVHLKVHGKFNFNLTLYYMLYILLRRDHSQWLNLNKNVAILVGERSDQSKEHQIESYIDDLLVQNMELPLNSLFEILKWGRMFQQ